MFLILNWNLPDDIAIAVDVDGCPLFFASNDEAKEYARENFAWNWMVVSIGH